MNLQSSQSRWESGSPLHVFNIKKWVKLNKKHVFAVESQHRRRICFQRWASYGKERQIHRVGEGVLSGTIIFVLVPDWKNRYFSPLSLSLKRSFCVLSKSHAKVREQMEWMKKQLENYFCSSFKLLFSSFIFAINATLWKLITPNEPVRVFKDVRVQPRDIGIPSVTDGIKRTI